MKRSQFSDSDLRALSEHGLSVADVERQLDWFRNPPPAIDLDRACVVGDGVVRLADEDHPRLLAAYRGAAATGRLSKFVPASGAASRMFKSLMAALGHWPDPDDPPTAEARRFIEELDLFPFADAIRDVAGNGAARDKVGAVVRPPLGYADLPKALIPLHRYPNETRTAFEEHLVEAAATVADSRGRVRLHMTVGASHQAAFEALLEEVGHIYETRHGVRYEVSFSNQYASTNTMAVDLENQPFRDADGSLLFRPGGHGSLLKNLSAWNGDLVLVKNIDNVVPDQAKAPTILWKELLAGYLAEIQTEAHAVLSMLADHAGSEALERGNRLGSLFRGRDWEPTHDAETLRTLLDRPLRICGVVRNTGEPGGGPFWVRADSTVTPQIVESAQLDLTDPEQDQAWQGATHFNPVDLALAVRDPQGQPYDLERFVDATTVFISGKSQNGRDLKALEHPGLWNGTMAGWNTVFLEVPPETFAPIKTVFDLLRPQHQPTPN